MAPRYATRRVNAIQAANVKDDSIEARIGKKVRPQADGCWIYNDGKTDEPTVSTSIGGGTTVARWCWFTMAGLDYRDYGPEWRYPLRRRCGVFACVAPGHHELVERDMICPNCGEERKFDRKMASYCSDKCRYTYRADDLAEMVEAARKSMDLGTATGKLRDLFLYLADRDGKHCHLCGRKVDLDRSDTKLGPSVDHIIPRSKGGSNELSNLALAHRGCNSAKGNRAVPNGEQLRLIG